jgi:hypothetical protein
MYRKKGEVEMKLKAKTYIFIVLSIFMVVLSIVMAFYPVFYEYYYVSTDLDWAFFSGKDVVKHYEYGIFFSSLHLTVAVKEPCEYSCTGYHYRYYVYVFPYYPNAFLLTVFGLSGLFFTLVPIIKEKRVKRDVVIQPWV